MQIIQGKGIPPAARAAVAKAGDQWPRFLRFMDYFTAFDAEPLVEDFGPFYACYRRLCRLGMPFDESFTQHVASIAQACRFGEDDPDSDPAEYFTTDADSDDEDEQSGIPFARATPGHFHRAMSRLGAQ